MGTSLLGGRRPPPLDTGLIEQLLRSEHRVAAVEATGLPDTPAEESFDSLTRLAARLLKVPASFVSLIKSDRDFYKSQSGFPPALAEARNLTGRTFCHYTLGSDVPLVIDDTHSDPVWRAVPTVKSLGVRAYAGVPLRVDGHTVGSFCVIDIKPHAWSHEELETLQQLAVSASREIDLRGALARERIESDNARVLARAKEEIVAVVAHDLRTPLQILSISTHILKKSLAGAHEAVTTRMSLAIDAMTAMADNLLSTGALLDAKLASRRDISAATLVDDAVRMMAPIAERAGMKLAVGETSAAAVTIDYPHILRALGNVIGNAIKYSEAGGRVLVSAELDHGRLHIRVVDQGKGMTTEEQSRAFERGWQGGAGMVRGDGAGLGLAIVKKLVEDHDGAVSISSLLNVGTTVTMSLPCRPPAD